MYRRYSPQNSIPQNGAGSQRPPADVSKNRQNGQSCSPSSAQKLPGPAPQQRRCEYSHAALNSGRHSGNLNFQPKPNKASNNPPRKPQSKNPLLGFIPPSVYNSQTKKILGFFEAEDLLLAALILILSESENSENSLLIYALLYIMLGDKFGF